jgi:hypothetical protein
MYHINIQLKKKKIKKNQTDISKTPAVDKLCVYKRVENITKKPVVETCCV